MVEVRLATPGDAAAIRHVHLAAFPTAIEADLVEQLKRDGDVAISLVAVDGGEIVGHVLFSRMAVEAEGRELNGLALAPVAVIPDRQCGGIGSALIRAGLQEAQANGTEIVFLVGEPEYYGRFQFDAEVAKPFASPYAGDYFQAKSLRALQPIAAGRADYAPAFAGLE